LLQGALAIAAWAQPAHDAFASRFNEIKRQATREQLYAFLFALPKGGDLHNHNDYSVFPELRYAAATDKARLHGNEYFTRVRIGNCPSDRQPPLLFETVQRSTYRRLADCVRADFEPLAGLSPELRERWISAMKLDLPGEGRNEFFEGIVPRTGDLTHDPYLVPDLLVENMKRFGAEGVRYLETQAGPSFQDQDGQPMDLEAGVERWRNRLAQPDAQATGVVVRMQTSILRFAPTAEQSLQRVFAFVAAHRDLWVGVNMVGREDNAKGYPLRFLDTFRRLRRTYSDVPLSIHAGEVDSPGRQVHDTLLLGARRIGHGVNLISDPDTMLLMRGGPYLVEINLVSNYLLEYTPDFASHPFPEYLRTGIPVCLNTDDRGAWDSNMTDEYFAAVTTFDLTWKEIVELGRNSLAYSFAEPPLKEKLLREYDAAVGEFERRFSAPGWAAMLDSIHPSVSGFARRTFKLGTR
jgi:adenosine deaminase CECR1